MAITDKVIIFDTTLRDAEQTPGASLTVPDKMEIAKQLARLQVDVIEGQMGAVHLPQALGGDDRGLGEWVFFGHGGSPTPYGSRVVVVP